MPDLDQAIIASSERAFSLLERLVSQPSTLGREHGGQEVLVDELGRTGFAVERLFIPDEIREDPAAGIPPTSYAGRYAVVGRRGDRSGRSLILNGHMDVVPAEDSGAWTSPPFSPTRRDGWLHGRGAGDMKAGFAAGLLALWGLDEAQPGWLNGSLVFVSAIEEEATGNGTLASARAGVTADGAILLEPTDLSILLGGIAEVWVRIEIEGTGGRADATAPSINPVIAALPLIAALRALEDAMNEEHAKGASADPAPAGIDRPYVVDIGRFHAGDWSSSLPATARLDIRICHPATWSSEEAIAQVRDAVGRASADDPWLSIHPPQVRPSGYRVERYLQDGDAPLVQMLASAHAGAHGAAPRQSSVAAPTDARFYVNQFGMQALAYGPRARAVHGVDEAVELQSIVDTARTLARFLLDWYRS